MAHHYMGDPGMLYSIDLIAAGGMVFDLMLPAIMLFFALALAFVFID
jgi:fumarate reductase subunit D